MFKHYFDREVFKELQRYYNKRSFRFEFKTVGERNKIAKFLDLQCGFEIYFIEDYSGYVVKLGKHCKYAGVLREAVAYKEVGEERLFLMKDLKAVEQAIQEGAEPYKAEVEF